MKKLLLTLTTMMTLMMTLLALTACSHDHAYEGPKPKTYAPIPPVQAVTKVAPGLMELVYEPKVDILFVVDDSLSMLDHQKNYAHQVENLINAFAENKQLDFHIGVVTVFDKISDDKVRYAQSRGGDQDFKLQPPAGSLRPLKGVNASWPAGHDSVLSPELHGDTEKITDERGKARRRRF